MQNGAADHGEDEGAGMGGVMDQVVEEIVLDDSENLRVLSDCVAAQFDGGVDEDEGEELHVLVGVDGSDTVGDVDDHLADVQQGAEEVEDVDHAARAVGGGGGQRVFVAGGVQPHVGEAHEDGLDELVHGVARAPLEEVAALGGLLHHLEAGVDDATDGVVGEEDGCPGAEGGGEHLEDAHEDGVLGGGVGVLQPAVGDGEDDGVDGVASAGGVLVKHVMLENLEDGGEGDAGGGRRDVVALDHVQEGRQIEGGVCGAPLAPLPRVEEEGAEGLEGVDEVRVDSVVGYGDDALASGDVVDERVADDGENGSHLRVEHARYGDLPAPRRSASLVHGDGGSGDEEEEEVVLVAWPWPGTDRLNEGDEEVSSCGLQRILFLEKSKCF